MPRNAFYAQSGGVTAVINASAAGVIETARKHRKTISGSDSAPKKEVDMKALNDAMKALGSGDGNKKAATAGNVKKEEPAKLIKVEAADVSLLVSLLLSSSVSVYFCSMGCLGFRVVNSELLSFPVLMIRNSRPSILIYPERRRQNC